MMRALLLSGLATAILGGISLGSYDNDNTHLALLAVLIPIACVTATFGVRVWHRRPPTLIRIRRQPSGQEFLERFPVTATWSDFWNGLLQVAATRPSVNSRAAAVLIWQECRAAVAFGLVVLPLAAASMIATVVFRNWLLPTHIILCVVVIECGLRTLRHDQQRLNGLFWSHRGVSPGMVWFVRIATWCLTMVLLLASIVFLELFILMATLGRIPSALERVTVWESIRSIESLQRVPGRPWAAIGEGVVAGGFGGFTIAQLASCWERKPLVAGLLALISVVIFWVWTGYVVSFGMPLVLLVWPLVAIAFVAGFTSRRRWMDRRTGRFQYFLRALTVLVPAAAMWPVSQWYWATEVPESYSQLILSTYTNPEATYVANGYTEANATSEWAEAWKRATDSVASRPDVTLQLWQEKLAELPKIDDTTPSAAVADVDLILKCIAQKPQHLPPAYRVGDSAQASTRCSGILRQEARRLRTQAKGDASLLRLVQAVELCRFQQSEVTNAMDWRSAVYQERHALNLLRHFSADDAVTEEQLQTLFSKLEQASSVKLSLVALAENQYIVCRQLMKREGYLWEHLHSLSLSKFYRDDLAQLSWSQRERNLRWAGLVVDAANGVQSDWVDENVEHLDAYDSGVRHYVDTAPLEAVRSEPSWIHNFRQALMDDRKATAIILGLQQYRRKNAKFPERLEQLRDIGIGRDHSWLGEALASNTFSYAPNGYGAPVPLYVDSGHTVRLIPTQPLLWSSGHMGPAQLRRLVLAESLSAHPLAAGEIYYICGAGGSGPMSSPGTLKRAIEDPGAWATHSGVWP
jgi:hypothetical protein